MERILGNGTWSGPDLLREIPTGGLELKWKLPIAPRYSRVTVADGMAFLMDKPNASGKEEQERVLCVDVDTGKLAWSFTYPVDYKKLDYGGPRASITTDAGKVFGLGAMGHGFCLDGETGKKMVSKFSQGGKLSTTDLGVFMFSEPLGKMCFIMSVDPPVI